MGRFLSENEFRSGQDLNGKAAAEYLKAQGATNIKYKDLGTNGLAVANLDGMIVTLSTNGFYSEYETDKEFIQNNQRWVKHLV